MNSVSTKENQALEAVMPAQSLLLLPVAKLIPSKCNVRKTGGVPITELAASIARVGLLQNLAVVPAEDGEHFEVVAGGRRLAALKFLEKKKRLPKDYEVPCLLVPDASARTASLIENVQREAMHPADQFEAFAALIAEGRSVEDIAADFGVTPLVVQRRLKLANVSPRLMADYRKGNVNLDQLMALAVTDDHTAQEAAFYDAPQWQRHPEALREHLTACEIDASRNPLVRLVGLKAYEAAGGAIRRDLFADDDKGVFLSDVKLLTDLALAKLTSIADEVRTERWSWVDILPGATHADLHAFQRAPMERREPTAKEAKRIAKLQEKIKAAEDAVEAAIEAEDEDRADKLQDEAYRLGEELSEAQAQFMTWADTIRSAAGAVITLDHDGKPVIHRGLLREAEAKALRALAKLQERAGGNSTVESGETEKGGVSEKLARRLTAHHTAALQVELARNPQAALAATVHNMVLAALREDFVEGLPLGVSLRLQDRLDAHAPDLPQSPAAAAMNELRQSALSRVSGGGDDLLAMLLAMAQDELVAILAICVARTLDGVSASETDRRSEALARAVRLDMHAWWTSTADGYFAHVSKARILEAVQQFAPEEVTRLSKLKKADLASEAERLVAGTGWLPPILREHEPVAVSVLLSGNAPQSETETDPAPDQ